ncbi:tRNA pseudouridine synthase A [Candidatus Gastranaerophilus sp. (ex Termes propinquus)]|nr:tRNA pseudouridine synthase A [Candidatus Gastranaerophilus sp. (ex Termes propinquus)]
MRYLLKVQYLGKNYCGSQKQLRQNTIQNEIEKALRTLTGQKISAIFSGRTDSGVNALGQTFHIDLEKEDGTEKFAEKFIHGLNHLLPDDIVILSMEEKNGTFHAQKSAKYRHYRYLIRSAQARCVFDTNIFFTRQLLDEKRMNESLRHILGEHDFSAFKSSSDNPQKICNIYFAEAVREGDYIKIDIIGNRFLYNMVRTIVGTVLLIEKNDLSSLRMAEILKSKDRTKAGATAEAVGLTLIEVGYTDKYTDKYAKLSKTERQINENI